jgi:hypothetical protein
MPIRAECASCHKRFKADDKLAGRRAKCPQCGGIITLPKPQPMEPAAELPAPSSPLDLDDIPIQNEPPPVQNCPSCNASLSTGAVLCIQCGYDLRKGAKVPTQNAPDPDPVEDLLIGRPKFDDEDEDQGSQLPQWVAFLRGCAISFGCATVGAILYAIVGHFLGGLALGLVTLSVGALAGMGMAVGYRHDDILTGLAAAAITFIGVIMGQVIWYFLAGTAAASDMEDQIADDSYAIEEAWDDEYSDADYSGEDLSFDEVVETEIPEEELSPEEIEALEKERAEFEDAMRRSLIESIVTLLLLSFWDIVALIFACAIAFQLAREWNP